MEINTEKLLQDPRLAEAERAIAQHELHLEDVVHSLYHQLFQDAFADCKQIKTIGLHIDVLGSGFDHGYGYNVWLMVNDMHIADHWLWSNTDEQLYAEPAGSITHTTLALEKAYDALRREDTLAKFHHRKAEQKLDIDAKVKASVANIDVTYHADKLAWDAELQFRLARRRPQR